MCEICGEWMDKVFPGESDEYKMSVLWNRTAFPFADGYVMARQIKRARKAITQGKEICMACGKVRSSKHMDFDMCKKPCSVKWQEIRK